MIFLIDIGNTNTVVALSDGKDILARWRCKTDSGRTGDEYAAWLLPLLKHAGYDLHSVEAVLISSVVPEANFNLLSLSRLYCDTAPRFVGRDIFPKIDITLPKPEEIGADRLVNALAVKTHYSAPAIIIDFGTATTFDVLDGKGRYAGGAIAAGINLSIDALHRAAAKLPRVSISRPDKAIGTSTVEAMQSGIYWGYTGLIEGMVTRMKDELGGQATVLATGGLAPLFARDIEMIDIVDEDLTMKGLLEIYRAG